MCAAGMRVAKGFMADCRAEGLHIPKDLRFGVYDKLWVSSV